MKAVEFHNFEMLGSKVPEMAKKRMEVQITVLRSRGPRYKLDVEVQQLNTRGKRLIRYEV
jgi:hypothetical protein